MYWIYVIIFLVAVLTPDIVREDFYFFPQERTEEIVIFLLGAVGFFIFVITENKLTQEKKIKKTQEKKLDQTGKDLAESYGYIGEVNRKMDILMNTVLGFSGNAMMENKKQEEEAYSSAVEAAKLLMKADWAYGLFVNIKEKKVEKTVKEISGRRPSIKVEDLTNLGGDINIKKLKNYLLASSPNKINGIRSYFVIENFSLKEEKNPKNLEILKVLASQALFLFSFAEKQRAQRDR